ncbi:MAG: bifunctional DNA-formamidopyrimidine glycosylase/DNA-(apurinic or apyrimidinic site) lyase [Porticoccaceae bacterium]|nr:bifunctional DNA-formamidopyrimidine glycosylase/DNA-(apurinic or apyrimidinic site) lyase [Porticoccaceae bacterium]
MPELPEVETTLRGVTPWLKGAKIAAIAVRQPSLRWPVTPGIEHQVAGQTIVDLSRRAKYLCIHLQRGSMLIHLGMSGSLRIVSAGDEWRKHDHIELQLTSGRSLRYHDPRRFGSWLWSEQAHWQLQNLGPEPLTEYFDGEHLYALSRGRKVAVKPFVMTNAIVVGVGNIYASEALFMTGIRPDRSAGRIALARYQQLATNIKSVLTRAIEQGGTTLRDFVNSSGAPGYFQQQLLVYGRAGQNCLVCHTTLREQRLGQRSSVYCIECQR